MNYQRLRWRRWHWFYAWVTGHFWLPCPRCGQMFGGHERHGWPHFPTNDPRTFLSVCAAHGLTLAGLGDPCPTCGVGSGDDIHFEDHDGQQFLRRKCRHGHHWSVQME